VLRLAGKRACQMGEVHGLGIGRTREHDGHSLQTGLAQGNMGLRVAITGARRCTTILKILSAKVSSM